MVDEAGIQLRYEALDPILDERGRRRFAAAEARAAGHGGVAHHRLGTQHDHSRPG